MATDCQRPAPGGEEETVCATPAREDDPHFSLGRPPRRLSRTGTTGYNVNGGVAGE